MRLSLSGRSSRSLNFLLLLAPDHGPALELGNRPALLDPHQIANRVRVGFVVRISKDIKRADGSVIRFDRNAAVLITPQMEPVGTRIFGPVMPLIREKMLGARGSIF